MKIIFSSTRLLDFIKKAKLGNFEYCPIIIKDGKFYFDGRKDFIEVEVDKRIGISFNTKTNQFVRLGKILSQIQEQPIVIEFKKDDDWFYLKEVVI